MLGTVGGFATRVQVAPCARAPPSRQEGVAPYCNDHDARSMNLMYSCVCAWVGEGKRGEGKGGIAKVIGAQCAKTSSVLSRGS